MNAATLSENRPRVAVFAGGTGGHIYPALAVARELADRGYEIHWFGTNRGLEARVAPAAGFALTILPARGLRGHNIFARVLALGMVLAALLRAAKALLRLRPVCALGMGGYSAGPAGIAAWITRVPLVIHEQNAVAGLSNRLLRPFASRVLCAWPDAFSGGRVSVVGNPVRRDLLERAQQSGHDFAHNFAQGDRPLHLLVLGGSLGAAAINEVAPQAVAALPDDFSIEVRHQSGAEHLDTVRRSYRGGVSVQVEAFIEDMAEAYDWADLVICRAGALTIAELAVMSRPAILVPLPGAVDDHQWHNARRLESGGGASLVLQAALTPAYLAARIRELAARPERLQEMGRAAGACAQPDAARAVADCCEAVRRGAS